MLLLMTGLRSTTLRDSRAASSASNSSGVGLPDVIVNFIRVEYFRACALEGRHV